jgi:outer membrane protein assembly factor BamB/precorrin-6B methylase 2
MTGPIDTARQRERPFIPTGLVARTLPPRFHFQDMSITLTRKFRRSFFSASLRRRQALWRHAARSIALAVCLLTSTTAADWPMLGRDATRNPVSPEPNPPTEWNLRTGRNVPWKAVIGSTAFAEPVVSGGMVWIGSNNRYTWDASFTDESATLLCFSEHDGRRLHEYVMPPLKGPLYRLGQVGLNGSSLIEGDQLWFVSARGEVIAWDIGPLRRGEGNPRELWKRGLIEEFGVYPRMTFMGDGKLCSIPASYHDRIYVNTGNGAGPEWPGGGPMPAPEAPSLICFQKDTGEVLWIDRSPGTNVLAGQWGSPLVAEINGRGQVITPQGDGWLRSFDAETGALIWQFDVNPKNLKSPHDRNHFLNTPVLYENRVYIGGGQDLEMGQGPGRLWCIDPTNAGDISLELDDGPHRAKPNPNSGVVWHYDQLGRTRSSVAIRNDLLIAHSYEGIVHCLDPHTGSVLWTHDTGTHLFASPLVVADKVYSANEDGVVHVFALERVKRLIARHELDAPFYSSPVFANGMLYLATATRLHAIANDSQTSYHDWPQWRGPDRSNASRETGLLEEWPTNGPPLLWTLTGLGEGITAMAVADGQAYTLGYRDEAEFLFCLDAESGDTRWISRIGSASDTNQVSMHGLMRWLSPRVPTVDKDRIYTLTAGGALACLRTADGGLWWSKSYPNDFLSTPRLWGFCDYPLVDGENLICTPGGPGATVVALNKRTGELLWKSAVTGGEAGTYAATMLSTAHGIRHYVVFLNGGPVGIAADDGRLLWRYERATSWAATSYTPIVRADFIFMANGYNWGMALLKLVPEGGGITAVEQYHRPFGFNPFQDNTVLAGDHIYAVDGPGKLVCLELQTGNLVWEQAASDAKRRVALTCADGHLFVRRSDGSMTLVEATPTEYVVKGSFQVPNPEEVSGVTVPVVANSRLYLRDSNRLLCYDLRADALSSPRPEAQHLAIDLSAVRTATDVAIAAPPRTGTERAPDAIFVSTPRDVVAKMLELAELDADSVLCDLGSGDGRIAIAAARQYGCQAIGYEIDPRLVELSRENVRANGLEHLVTIEHADLFTADLSGADAIVVYLPSNLLERMLPQFSQLKPGARIVSHQFPIPGQRPATSLNLVSTEDGDRHRVLLWKTPLNRGAP